MSSRFDDLVVTDPRAMRALAHPVRLAILTQLQRSGPATASGLSSSVGATPSVTSWHLRHLASFGLVADADPAEVPGDGRTRWWQARARGFSVEVGDDPEAREAGRLLGDALRRAADEQVDAWHRDVEPVLEPVWQARSGVSNTSITLTAQELARLQDDVDALLAPYVLRAAGAAPSGARRVRLVRTWLPDGPG